MRKAKEKISTLSSMHVDNSPNPSRLFVFLRGINAQDSEMIRIGKLFSAQSLLLQPQNEEP